MWANSTTGSATKWIFQGDKLKGLTDKTHHSLKFKGLTGKTHHSLLYSVVNRALASSGCTAKKRISSIWLVGNIFIDYALQKIRLVPLVGKVDRCWITYAPVLVHFKR